MSKEEISYDRKIWRKYMELRTEMINRSEKILKECTTGFITLGEITALQIGHILEHIKGVASISEDSVALAGAFEEEVRKAWKEYLSLMKWYCEIRYREADVSVTSY